MVLNTSFNENEPVVCKPEEALDCFLRTKMDRLVLGNVIIARRGSVAHRLQVISIFKMEIKQVYLLADLIVKNTISDSLTIWPSSPIIDQQHALDRRSRVQIGLAHPTKYEARYVEHGRAALALLYSRRNS